MRDWKRWTAPLLVAVGTGLWAVRTSDIPWQELSVHKVRDFLLVVLISFLAPWYLKRRKRTPLKRRYEGL